jgi:hypothetical protein
MRQNHRQLLEYSGDRFNLYERLLSAKGLCEESGVIVERYVPLEVDAYFCRIVDPSIIAQIR